MTSMIDKQLQIEELGFDPGYNVIITGMQVDEWDELQLIRAAHILNNGTGNKVIPTVSIRFGKDSRAGRYKITRELEGGLLITDRELPSRPQLLAYLCGIIDGEYLTRTRVQFDKPLLF
jgi:hypothetical protein